MIESKLSERALEKRRAYYRKYYAEHREELKEKARARYRANPKHKYETDKRYWEKKAHETAED